MINTVRGPISKSQMGNTLAHEHFNWLFDEDFACKMYYDKQYDDSYNEKILTKILPILDELKLSGCQTIVEASPPLGGQNLKLLYEISKLTNLNIIPCTGMNISKYAHRIFYANFEEALASRWIDDFRKGLDVIDHVCIKPGYIKLLLDRGGVNAVDEAMLKAAAIASKSTGMPIHCHVLEAQHMPKVVAILEEMAVPPHKFVWAHADHESDIETILQVVKKGYWVGFDAIREGTYDARLALIKHAISHNYAHQVILSVDYDFYEESEKVDGIKRYTAFFKEFLPYCEENGIASETIKNLITENPSRFYDI